MTEYFFYQTLNVPTDVSHRYFCGDGMAYNDSGTIVPSLVARCQWDKSWSMAEQTDCVITHCIGAPSPASSLNLVDRLGIDVYTPINERRMYDCKYDHNWETDFNKNTYGLLCFPNGTYETPEWPKCVKSKLQWLIGYRGKKTGSAYSCYLLRRPASDH